MLSGRASRSASDKPGFKVRTGSRIVVILALYEA